MLNCYAYIQSSSSACQRHVLEIHLQSWSPTMWLCPMHQAELFIQPALPGTLCLILLNQWERMWSQAMPEGKVKGIQQMDINPIAGISYAVHANEWLMASKAIWCPLVLTSFLAGFVMEKGVEEMAGMSTKLCGYIVGIHLRWYTIVGINPTIITIIKDEAGNPFFRS